MKMEMEGLLHRHLCCPRYPSLPSLYPLRFLFLLFTLSISCLPPSCRACEEPWECGNLTFSYPFTRMNSGCGDPALQVDCDRTANMPLMNISGYQYYILDISENWHEPDLWHEDHTITIIDKDQWSQRCNPLFINHATEIWSSPQFSITDGYKNLTLWEDCPLHTIQEKQSVFPLSCNNSWYLNSTEDLSFGKMCRSQVTLPVPAETSENSILDLAYRGLRIRWKPTEACGRCLSLEGLCAYEINSVQFSCINCKDSPNPAHCRSGFADKSTTKPAKPIILARAKFSGGIMGSAALLLMGACLLFLNRKRFSPASSQDPDLFGVEKFLQDYVHQMPCRYSYSQLTKITNKFAHKVGEGGFGVVYKGKLPTGELVAVKMLDQSRRCENQFMNEVATLGRIHHVHLVRLMGYFYEEYRNALVYEYMANGSLDEFIFAGREKEATLNWAQLYPIALGAARGIAYLHQDCDNRIIHFDIKPHNILLDVDFTPKIADFGLAKLCGRGDNHISMTAARGTPGYAAPEVWNRNLGPVTDKSDVYSFGMVLLEMVGGRKNVDVQVSRSSQLYFPEWAFKLMEKGELERGLRGSGKAEIECEEKEKAIRLAKVGLWCIQYNSRDRPSMSRVVQMLEGNCDVVGNPPLPFNSSIRAAPSIQSSEESSV